MTPISLPSGQFSCLDKIKNILKPDMHIFIERGEWTKANNLAASHPEKVNVSYLFQDTVELLLEKNSRQSLYFLTALIQAGKITQLKPSYYTYAFKKGNLQYLITNHGNFITDQVANELIQMMQNNPQSHYAEASALLLTQNGRSLGRFVLDNFVFFSEKVNPSLVDPNLVIDNESNTILFLAARLDCLDIVKKLKVLGANFSHQNAKNETVYHVVMQQHAHKTATYFISQSPSDFTSYRDNSGKTALEYLDMTNSPYLHVCVCPPETSYSRTDYDGD